MPKDLHPEACTPIRHGLLGAGWVSLGLAVVLGCSDAGLQPREPQPTPGVDNLLRIDGTLCSDEPERTSYPVKILFAIDASGSMQFTDPNRKIRDAVHSVVERLRTNPSVRFAILSFNGIVRINSADPVSSDNRFDHVTPQSLGRHAGFYPGNQLPPGALDSVTIRDSVTDYQGALGAIYRLLEMDMLASSPAERTRTKYVVVFLSDGWPNPQCNTDCMNPQAQPVCLDRRGLPPEARDAFPELKSCQDYNQPYQIFAKVDQIMRLRDIYAVGDLRFHTAWLRDPNDVISGQFGYKPEDARDLLFKMAVHHGNGTFADYYRGDEVTFANIDYTSILRPYGLSQVLVWNTNAVPTPGGFGVDSDGDGLSDEREGELGTDPKLGDTDGDGFRDGFEEQRLARGFDPRLPSKPWYACSDRTDLDADGLLTCEEQVIGTDPRLPDSDSDRMPDGLEVRYGLDPLTQNGAMDDDADGIFNIQEVAAQTHPLVADPMLYRDHRTSYAITALGERAGQQRCYEFSVRQIELVGTAGQRGPASRGVNRILLYFGQAPLDAGERDPGRWRIGCVDAVFVPPAYKLPATGQFALSELD
ncbi:MAG: VWA domain-containing protein, partial [Myxococcota bacterium]|nr:VWA domain-containing protein [Myxococcota bacterium]